MHSYVRAYSCLGPFKEELSFEGDFLFFCFRIYFSNFFYHFLRGYPAGYLRRALNVRDVLRGVPYCICKLLLSLLSLQPDRLNRIPKCHLLNDKQWKRKKQSFKFIGLRVKLKGFQRVLNFQRPIIVCRSRNIKII